MSSQIAPRNTVAPHATPHGIRLGDILPDAEFLGAEDFMVRSCCGQWDACQRDDLFVAIVGAEVDGHEFSHEAVKRGASAVVTERLLAIDRPQCIVPDSRHAYGKICQALAGRPSQRIVSVGIGGSDGKTVTSHLTRSIFRKAQQQVGLVSSIELDLGVRRPASPHGEPNAATVADHLSKMVLAGCSHAVVEVSSPALAQRTLAGVEFDLGVITNLRRDHLRFHGSTENHHRALLRLLKQLKPGGVAIMNADDPVSHRLLDKLDLPTLTYAMKQDAPITAKVLERTTSEQTFMISAGSESVPVRVDTIGNQHVYNCLAATAVGLASGIDLSTIAAGLEAAGRIPGRLERVVCGQSFGVWIDAARNANQLATAINAIKQVTPGSVWTLFSTHREDSASDRRRLGEVVERSSDRAIITQTSGDKLIDYEPFHQILDGFDDPECVQLIPNRFRAIEWVLEAARPGDAVLISGCGERPFALLGENDWPIADRDVCESWLYDQVSILPPTVTNPSAPTLFHIDDYRSSGSEF